MSASVPVGREWGIGTQDQTEWYTPERYTHTQTHTTHNTHPHTHTIISSFKDLLQFRSFCMHVPMLSALHILCLFILEFHSKLLMLGFIAAYETQNIHKWKWYSSPNGLVDASKGSKLHWNSKLFVKVVGAICALVKQSHTVPTMYAMSNVQFPCSKEPSKQ